MAVKKHEKKGRTQTRQNLGMLGFGTVTPQNIVVMILGEDCQAAQERRGRNEQNERVAHAGNKDRRTESSHHLPTNRTLRSK